MPNWTRNYLTVATDCPEGVAARELIEGALKEYDPERRPNEFYFDFDAIVPMPELIKHTTSETNEFRGDYSRFSSGMYGSQSFTDDERREFTDEEEQELARIGSRDWHDWCNKHWGTKWYGHRAAFKDEDRGFLGIEFDTAWSTPYGVLQAIVDRTGATVVCLWRNEDDWYRALYRGTFKPGVEPTEEIVEEEPALI